MSSQSTPGPNVQQRSEHASEKEPHPESRTHSVRQTSRNALLLGLISAIALFAAWQWRAPEVQTVTPIRGTAAEVVYATGLVEPRTWARVTALARKRIVDTCRCEGKIVAKGEVLARLDDLEEKAVLSEIVARHARTKEDVDRLRGLVERNVTSRVTYEDKLTQLRELEARISAQKDRIYDLELRAPMDGVVLRRDGEVGEITGTGTNDVLFWIGQPKPLRIVADVNEEDIAKVKQGQRVLLRHEGFQSAALSATVDEITLKGDPATKTFRVYFALPDDSPLMIGMSVEANVIVREVRECNTDSDGGAEQRRGLGRHRRPPRATHSRHRHQERAHGPDSIGPGTRSRRCRSGPAQRKERHACPPESGATPMNLALDIAVTHVRSRLRQTLVGIFGVAMGVGFSVMMAALMDGSQRDFVSQLVDSLPHITISDERRTAPPQPAETLYDLVSFSGVTTPVIRPGIKNPYATIAALDVSLDGAVAPSVQTKAVIRFAGRDTAASITGIDPRREASVSKLVTQVRGGTLESLQKASNAIIIGDKLAAKIGARIGNTITLVTGNGRPLSCTIVALFHSGVSQFDESQAYTLLKTAQILAGQTGLVNAIRIRSRDIMAARETASRIEAETGYKSVSWQEANEDLLSAFEIRNFIMYAVVGAILLVASFGIYNIISTITHEKTRDIAILKSLGFTERLVRRIFLIEALLIGTAGMIAGWALGYVLCLALGTIEFRSPFMDATRLPIYYTPAHYALAGAIALAASAIAGYLPARKASRVQPVEIIRGAS